MKAGIYIDSPEDSMYCKSCYVVSRYRWGQMMKEFIPWRLAMATVEISRCSLLRLSNLNYNAKPCSVAYTLAKTFPMICIEYVYHMPNIGLKT